MEDLKSKRAGYKKFNDSLTKLPKKVRKKKTATKKKKNKENLKTANTETSLYSEIFKPRMQKSLGRLRVKTIQGIEGKSVKGLCSEYITRKTLNEARKNEDINRIIEIGKAALQKKEPLEGPLKCLYEFGTDDGDPGKSANVPNYCIEDFGQFFWSPISEVTSTYNEDLFRLNPRISRNKKLDLEKEFEKFSEKYEETIARNVLLKLPKNGVLEYALNALRLIRKHKQNDPKNVLKEFQAGRTQFSKEFKYSSRDFESETPAAKDFVNDFIPSLNLLVPKTDYRGDTLMEKSLSNELLTPDESENYQRLIFQPISGIDGSEAEKYASAFQEKNPENSDKDLYITTPPIHFYRRNMF